MRTPELACPYKIISDAGQIGCFEANSRRRYGFVSEPQTRSFSVGQGLPWRAMDERLKSNSSFDSDPAPPAFVRNVIEKKREDTWNPFEFDFFRRHF